jgi:hypothetical protein
MSEAKPINPQAAAALVASGRWKSKITDGPGGCVLWTAGTSSDGYGRVRVGARTARAHRVAYVAATGRDVGPGLVLDHLCRVRNCVNPLHLRAVTDRENVLAHGSLAPAAINSDRTHCSAGHLLQGDNLRRHALRRGRRQCDTCHRQETRLRDAAIRSAFHALGVAKSEYVATYGQSHYTALAVLAGITEPDRAKAAGRVLRTWPERISA